MSDIKTRKSLLARLMAKENIDVRYGGFSTASFDVVNRVLRMPVFKQGMSDDVFDLMTGHEVGHALFTPADGWHGASTEYKFPRALINIVEDIRIERMIQNMYPGLKGSFKRGYTDLLNMKFFGHKAATDINSMGFLDRLNIKAKCRDLVSVKFNSDEIPYVKMAASCETFDEVLEACEAIYAFLKEKKEETPKDEKDMHSNPQSSPEDQEENSGEADTDSSAPQDSTPDGEGEEGAEASSSTTGDDEKSEDTEEKSGNSVGSDDSGNSEETSATNGSTDESPVDDEVDSVVDDNIGSETDDEFRRNEQKMIDENIHHNTCSVSGYTKEEVESIVYTYDDAKAVRDEYFACMNVHHSEHTHARFDKMIDESDKVASLIAKEFEMRKAAYQHQRATTAKSGQLDVTKLHDYKFSDDLFLSHTTLADAKDHGLIMLMDYSGSMGRVLANVISQTITLALFCRKVNIPFEVYSFTSGRSKSHLKNRENALCVDSLLMVNRMSSTMKRVQFKEACFETWAAADARYKHGLSAVDGLGGTPTIQALSAMDHLIAKFKKQHQVQKTNFVMISDGNPTATDHTGLRGRAVVELDERNVVPLSHYYGAAVQATMVKWLAKRHNVNTHCYFIVDRNLGDLFYAAHKWSEKKEVQSNIRRTGFHKASDWLGFQNMYILSGAMTGTTDEFDVEEDANIKDIKKAFKKFASSKRGNRAMSVEFAKAVS